MLILGINVSLYKMYWLKSMTNTIWRHPFYTNQNLRPFTWNSFGAAHWLKAVLKVWNLLVGTYCWNLLAETVLMMILWSRASCVMALLAGPKELRVEWRETWLVIRNIIQAIDVTSESCHPWSIGSGAKGRTRSTRSSTCNLPITLQQLPNYNLQVIQ